MKNNMESILEFNKQFVDKREYEQFLTNKYPDKRWLLLPAWIPGSSSCFPGR